MIFVYLFLKKEYLFLKKETSSIRFSDFVLGAMFIYKSNKYLTFVILSFCLTTWHGNERFIPGERRAWKLYNDSVMSCNHQKALKGCVK